MAFLGPQGPAPKDNRGPLLQEVQWIEFSIGTIVLGLRLCSRAKHLGKLFTDDYIMIAAWVSKALPRVLYTDLIKSVLWPGCKRLHWHCSQLGIWTTLPEFDSRAIDKCS